MSSMPRDSGPLRVLIATSFALLAAVGFAAPALGADSCPTRVIGVDPALSNTYGDTDLGEGIGQTFYAADTVIRSLTVWQSKHQNDWLSGADLYLTSTTDEGVPDGENILFRGDFVRSNVGDGIHPIPLVFEFDPPWVLPHAGEYAFWLFGCKHGHGDFLMVHGDTAAMRALYPDGHAWGERARFICRPRGAPDGSYPDAHLAFRIVFDRAPAAGQIALASVRPESCNVDLAWRDGSTGALSATVMRRVDQGDWEPVGPASSDGSGRLVMSDTTVVPGTRYWYSLRLGECDLAAEGVVDTPGGLGIAFTNAVAADGALRVGWSAASRGPFSATVYRRGVQTDDRYPVDETWRAIGSGPSDVSGHLVFDDTHAIAQAVYDYRLGADQCGREAIVGLARNVQAPCGVSIPALATDVTPCEVRVRWAARDSTRHTAALYRRRDGGDWTYIDQVLSDPVGRSAFRDLSVSPGEALHYRIGMSDCGGEYFSDEAEVLVPGAVVTTAVAHASRDHANLAWTFANGPRPAATIYRWSRESDWQPLAQAPAESSATLEYQDNAIATAIPPGGYRYRLGVVRCGQEAYLGEVGLDVPDAAQFTITGVRPNPTGQDLNISFYLPDGAPVTCEVLDLAGRRMLFRDLGAPGPGSHVLDLTAGHALPSGVYLIRLARSGAVSTARAVIVH